MMAHPRQCCLLLKVLSYVAVIYTCAASAVQENAQQQPLVGHRFPPLSPPARDDDCHNAGALCTGPGRSYPLGRQPGVLLYSLFTVPSLPETFDRVKTTYYDYFNIYWARQPDGGGYMNQFVPQLMLGNALANSSNYPHYDPYWIELDTWHIGAQYFMGLCDEKEPSSLLLFDTAADFICDDNHWIPKAATGKLIPVEPGELIETSFELIEVEDSSAAAHNATTTKWEWHLRMGVVGQPHRSSIVVSDRPFMGLVEATTSWKEDRYEDIYVGSCLENYGMNNSRNYPPNWDIVMELWPSSSTATSTTSNTWSDWNLQKPSCPWQPKSTVETISTPESQRVEWKATLDTTINGYQHGAGAKVSRTRV